jgi:hypothetical protein
MELTYDLIDYKLLAGMHAEEILFNVFENDKFTDQLFIKSGYDFGVSDSYIMFGKLQDICELIKKRRQVIEPQKRNLFEDGLFPLFIPTMMYDDLNFKQFPEEGYISSVSYEHLRAIHQGFSQLTERDLQELFWNSESEWRPKLKEYLGHYSNMIQYGVGHDLGLLIHLG